MIPISLDTAEEWFKLLPMESRIGTLKPSYVDVDAKRDPSLTPLYLLYHEGEKFWLLSAHIMAVPGSEFRAISSAYGYGGPITNSGDPAFAARAWQDYKEWAWEHLILAEVMKLHPLFDHPYGGLRCFNRNVYMVGSKYASSCWNKIRKAQHAGLSVHVVDKACILENFPTDYYDSMEELKAKKFYMFNQQYFEALSKMPGASIVVCENECENWRSASIMIGGGGLTLESHLTITNEEGRKTGANNLLIHGVWKTLGLNQHFYLGGGKAAGEDDSLAKFKASFGGKKLPFHIGSYIHRSDVYREMKQGNQSDRVLFWQT